MKLLQSILFSMLMGIVPAAHAKPPATAAVPPPAATSGLRVTCEGDDVGAEVTVNGKFKGECPLDMQVPEGVLRLRVEKKDPTYDRVFEQEIRMGEGVMKKVEVKLPKTLNAAGQQRMREETARLDAEGMVMIPAGSFEMGASDGRNDEKPAHRVDVKLFAMGKYHVTRGEFAKFVSETGHDAGNDCDIWNGSKWKQVGNWRNPGFTQADSHPVICVNWNDAQAYASWLSRKTGKQYRLPTEAEWEYACRAGGRHTYCGGNDINAVAWYEGNSGGQTHPVGQKQANGYGLYDMSGNVWEWVEDSYHNNYNGAPADGSAWQGDSAERMQRGGSWHGEPGRTRAASRGALEPAFRGSKYGFRLARTLP